jgi:hypothetical protein
VRTAGHRRVGVRAGRPAAGRGGRDGGEQGRGSDTRLAASAGNHGGQRITPDLPATGERRITQAVMSDFR